MLRRAPATRFAARGFVAAAAAAAAAAGGILVPSSEARAQNVSLKVASFNILTGGQGSGGPLSQTANVIQASGADIVGIQESDGSAPALAAMLGWNYRQFSFDR